MFIGELDFGALPVGDNLMSKDTILKKNTRYVYFLMFLFLVVVVMSNLLNGLAVSDIDQLQREADILAAKSEVEIINALVSSAINNSYITHTLTTIDHNWNNTAKAITM